MTHTSMSWSEKRANLCRMRAVIGAASCLGTLPPLQHDLAARLAAFQQRMGALEVGGVDRAKRLVERGAQHALVDEIGDIVEQLMLMSG